MIAIDTNILVHAHRGDSPFHEAAATVVSALANGSVPWAIPWPCVHEFLATVTHRRIFPTPTPLDAALAQVESWRASPSLVLLGETEDHWSTLADLVVAGDAFGPVIHDARVAAICLAHGVLELLTADRDFSRFPALRVRNPFVAR